MVHGGERFRDSVLIDDDVIAAIRSFAPLAPLQNPADLVGIEAIRAAEADLGARGRLLIRPSGTEPLIRVMVEAEEASMVERLTSELAETIRAVAATPERKPGTKSSRQEAAE